MLSASYRYPSRILGTRFQTRSKATDTFALVNAAKQQAENFGVDSNSVYDPSIPIDLFQRFATYLHNDIGMTWPTTLISMAALVRLTSFPIYASSIIKGKRRAEAARELEDLRNMAKEAVLLRDQQLVHDIDREYKRRMKMFGLSGNPFQGFQYLFLVQLPWVTTMLFSLRGMSTQPDIFPSFITESGFTWCPSLALPDPYGILPLLSSTSIVLSSLRSGNSASDDQRKIQSLSERDQLYVKYAIKGACFTFLPFAMQLPAGIIIFFLFNTIFNRLATPLIYKFMWKPICIDRQ
jgi:membrane protein insertase Oxa1/YidC/SpoIIIJ